MSAKAFRSLQPIIILLLILLACAKQPDSESREPLFGNLGSHHREVTTRSVEAQRYFDQGLVLLFAFNHDEAIRSFEEAARLDPKCAMAYWGIAFANGPHINKPILDEEQARRAWQALVKAQAAAGASPTERALIEALGKRYADPPPADRRPLDEAFAAAMREVWKAHPEDADLGSLFAESMMDLRPWDLWAPDGTPHPGTDEIIATLEAVLDLAPNHPLANHLYIHAVEASPAPERGVAAADRLRDLVPGAGHLVHMPGHIYTRVGRWADAAATNERAIITDREYRARSPEQGFYRIYMAHNYHFLSWASMMEGRSQEALKAARDMIAGIPPDFVRESALSADGYMTIEMETLMRFGRWEEILALPEPPEYLPITAAIRRSTRGVALAALGRVDEAVAEQRAFEEAAGRVTDEMVVGNNTAKHVLSIARHMLAGEILARQGKVDRAVTELGEAVKLEDELKYNESPDWLQPVRHALGAVLVNAKRYAEAEQVYRDDLAKNPENGWALFGLGQCLRARKASAEAEAVEARFQKAWSRADITLKTSCFCQAS